jgi:beta-lactam-binding protein with PASTA domain
MERLLNGRYRLGPRLGDGGMAVVYRGFDTALGRQVAIKVLRDQYAADRTFVARFEREAQSVAALNHPNIINIFDVGFDGDGPNGRGLGHYFVMELIDGPDLKELIRARGPMPAEEVVAILVQVLAGLGYAHARALVHRDIKPQNIMLTQDGTAKVTDFGIAKGLADTTLTDAGFGMGTVHYISPEQARGEPATPASDLYAVGVMLYEMLTGVLPFTGDSTVAVALKHVQEPPLSPKRLNNSIPAPLAAITLRALAKDPNERFTSASEMAAALADWPRWRDRRAAPPPDPRASRRATTAAVPPLYPPVPPPRGRASRGGVGVLTWLLGFVALLLLIAVLVTGYRLSPFGAIAASPTASAVAGLPPTETAGPPTETPTAEASATVLATVPVAAPLPTATIRPTTPVGTPLPTLAPTMTAPPPVSPTVRQSPTAVIAPPTATAATVPAPALAGKTLAEAKDAAAAVGLNAEQVGEGYSTRPVGQVISQQPDVGRPVPLGGTIAVVISRGPQTIAVPDVKGQGYTQAANQLAAIGLVAARRDVPSRAVPLGTVIDQDPLGGNSASPGATITLTVSLGDVVQVPDLFGVPFETARQRLADAGFSVNVNGQTRAQLQQENPAFLAANPNLQDGQVISQSLPSGSYQARGAAISIAYYRAR